MHIFRMFGKRRVKGCFIEVDGPKSSLSLLHANFSDPFHISFSLSEKCVTRFLESAFMMNLKYSNST